MFEKREARTRLWMMAAACAAALMCAGAAHAQAPTQGPTPAPEDEQEGSLVDEVVVTARGQVSDVSSASPVTVLDARDLARTGVTTLDQALDRIPQLGFQGVNAAQNTGGYGAAYADLRNLNFNRTVTVVNGRRFVLSGITTDEAVDLNVIPVALIAHVEVLRDGSQPEFGADAVAGVINIVLRHDFDGVAISTLAGVSGQGDGERYDASVTAGRNFERGNLTVHLGYTRREPVVQSDRDFARFPITSAEYGPGREIELERGLTATPGGRVVSGTGVDQLAVGGGAFRDFDPTTDTFDPSPYQHLQGGLDRVVGASTGRYDVSDHASVFFEALYAGRRSRNLAAPQALGLGGTARNPEGFVIPEDNPTNPFGEDVTLQRVLSEVGPQATTTRANTYRLVVGARGDWAGFEWELAYNHGRTDQRFSTRNSINLTRALQTVGELPCAGAAGCVAGDYFGPNSLSPAAVNYIRYTAVGRSDYQEDIFTAQVERVLRETEAGQWEIEGGVERRIERGRVTPDAVTLAGDQAGPDSAPTDGRIASTEAWFDLDLPLLAQSSVVGAVRFDVSGRYSDYPLFGSFPTWRASVNWSPIADFRVRASIGHARRVPAITEAFGGSTASLLAVTDPCDSVEGDRDNPTVDANCTAAGLPTDFQQNSPLIAVANGGSTALTPESSRNLTVGFVYTPRFAPELSITFDYWRIRITDAIDSLADTNPDFIPDQCYGTAGGASPFCGFITRVPSGPNAGQISLILAPDANLGEILTDGFDLGLTWRRELGSFGTLSVDWQTAYLRNYLIRETRDSEQVQYAGTFPGLNFVGAYSRWRSAINADLIHGPFTFSVSARYIGEADVLGEDPAEEPFTHANAVTYVDLEAEWRLGAATLAIGVENVGDVRPPTLIDGQSNTSLSTYDVIGRFVFARVSAAF